MGADSAVRDRLFGRDREISDLIGMLERRRDGRQEGALTLLRGGSGVGKTALARVLLGSADELGYDVYRIACEPFHEGMSFFPVRELVRQVADGGSFAEHIGHLFGKNSTQAEMAAVSESSTADPASRREALVATFANAILGRFRLPDARPIVLFMDDLEHLDAGSADALICLFARITEGPVTVLGAYRSDMITPTHPLDTLMGAARRGDGILASVDLDGFQENSLDELVEAMLGGPTALPSRFYSKLFHETDGNPLFIREVLRALRTPGRAGQKPLLVEVNGTWRFEGSADQLTIPSSVEEVIRDRLDQFDEEQRTELEFAAVIGRRFAFELLRKLLEAGEDVLLQHLERYLSVSLIRELKETDQYFEFSHGKIRDVLYDSLSGLRKRRIHGRVADALEELTGAANEDWDALIGGHLFKAARLPEAFPHLLRAARAAMQTGSSTEAADLFRKAIDSSERAVFDNDDSRQTIKLELAQALIYSSDVEDAENVLVELDQPDVPQVVRAAALNYLGDVQLYGGHVEEALETYARCEELARVVDSKEIQAEVACDLAELHGRQYERFAGIAPGRAEEHHKQYVEQVNRAYELLEVVGSGTLRARILRNKAKLSRTKGDLDEAAGLYEQSIACVDERIAGHRFLIPYAKALRLGGRYEDAKACVDRVFAWSSQIGSRRSEAIARQYRATIDMARADVGVDDLTKAEADAALALRLHQQVGFVQGIHETELVAGEIALRQGRGEIAMKHFRSAIEAVPTDDNELLRIVADELDANGEVDRAEYVRKQTGSI